MLFQVLHHLLPQIVFIFSYLSPKYIPLNQTCMKSSYISFSLIPSPYGNITRLNFLSEYQYSHSFFSIFTATHFFPSDLGYCTADLLASSFLFLFVFGFLLSDLAYLLYKLNYYFHNIKGFAQISQNLQRIYRLIPKFLILCSILIGISEIKFALGSLNVLTTYMGYFLVSSPSIYHNLRHTFFES